MAAIIRQQLLSCCLIQVVVIFKAYVTENIEGGAVVGEKRKMNLKNKEGIFSTFSRSYSTLCCLERNS